MNIIEKFRNDFTDSPDMKYREIDTLRTTVTIIFNESVSEASTINDFILKYLVIEDKKVKDAFSYLVKHIPNSQFSIESDYEKIKDKILNGFTAITVNGYTNCLIFETKKKLSSDISEATNEKIIVGPKDAFTENYRTNIGLIRKRIKSSKLKIKENIVGTKSKTLVGVVYLEDLANEKLVNKINKKISNIKIDSISGTNYIIECISKKNLSAFPTYVSTERPDTVTNGILDGKIAIVVDNSQYVVLLPAFLFNFIQSNEDYYQNGINVSFTRIIRILAFFIAIFGPALYIAVTTYNQEALPIELFISFATQRKGVPFPSVIELLLMILAFDILKETDIRTPTSMGGVMSIVGALVLGQSAVSAGIVSPIMVIVVAISAMSGIMYSSVEMINVIRWWRLIFVFLAALFGLVGVVAGIILLSIVLNSINSFDYPYLLPISPLFKKDVKSSVILSNKHKLNYRSSYLVENTVRKEENNEEI